MRFDTQAYEKVFPETPQTAPIESAVDTFKPTEAEKATDNKPGEELKATAPETKPEEQKPTVTVDDLGNTPEGA